MIVLYTVLFILALLALYALSRLVTNAIYSAVLLVTRSRTVAIVVITVIQFPGTIIHELSHMFVAEILGVPTGKLTLVPESVRGKQINVGSVSIAQTDPFRRYAIGLAPVYMGTVILAAIAFFLPGLWISVQSIRPELLISAPQFYLFLIAGYFMFAVSNAMFSSPKDLEGFPAFAITVSIFLAGLWITGIRVELTGQLLTITERISFTLVKSLGIVLAINSTILLILKLWVAMIGKITGLRVK